MAGGGCWAGGGVFGVAGEGVFGGECSAGVWEVDDVYFGYSGVGDGEEQVDSGADRVEDSKPGAAVCDAVAPAF